MILTAESSASAKTAVWAVVGVCTSAIAALVALAIAWLGLGLPFAKLDPAVLPSFFWYYRHDPAVITWLSRGALFSAVFIGLALVAIFRPRIPLHGAARFAREIEIRQEGLRAKSGIIVGRKGINYLVFGGTEHVLLEAPTRSGKGVNLVIPNLLIWPESVVVLDIKQENWEKTAGFRQKHGQQVFLFNPTCRNRRTARYNPLGHIDRANAAEVIIELQKIGTMLFPVDGAGENAAFWAESAITGFVGVGALVACDPDAPFTMGEIYRRVADGNMTAAIAAWMQKLGPRVSNQAFRAIGDFIGGSENTVSSTRKTITSKLNLWMDSHVDLATSASDFDLRELRQKPMSIYLGVSPDDLLRIMPLYNLFFQQLVDLNTRELPNEQAGTNTVKTLLLLDEFARLGKAKVIANGFSYVAGYGLRILIVIQSRAQLKHVYQQDMADEIVSNCGIEIAFTPKELSVAKDLSERLGFYGLKSTTHSRTIHGAVANRSRSESDQRRALMMPQELTQMDRSKLLVLRGGIPPIMGAKAPYYKSRFFMARVLPAPEVPALPKPKPLPKTDSTAPRPANEDELALITPVEIQNLNAPADSIFGDLSDLSVVQAFEKLNDSAVTNIGIQRYPSIFGRSPTAPNNSPHAAPSEPAIDHA